MALGPVGTAKTTLLKQIAYHSVLGGLSIRGGVVLQMLHDLKDFGHSAKVRVYEESLRGGHVLFLDDLDKILGSPYELSLLYLLTNHYWSNGRSIVYSMNMTPTQLDKKMSTYKGDDQSSSAQAIISRLMSRAQVVNCDGPDLRGRL